MEILIWLAAFFIILAALVYYFGWVKKNPTVESIVTRAETVIKNTEQSIKDAIEKNEK